MEIFALKFNCNILCFIKKLYYTLEVYCSDLLDSPNVSAIVFKTIVYTFCVWYNYKTDTSPSQTEEKLVLIT
jgi:hypothetical protein